MYKRKGYGPQKSEPVVENSTMGLWFLMNGNNTLKIMNRDVAAAGSFNPAEENIHYEFKGQHCRWVHEIVAAHRAAQVGPFVMRTIGVMEIENGHLRALDKDVFVADTERLYVPGMKYIRDVRVMHEDFGFEEFKLSHIDRPRIDKFVAHYRGERRNVMVIMKTFGQSRQFKLTPA